MKSPEKDVSLPDDLPGLEAYLADVERALKGCDGQVADLMRREDPSRGLYHAREIHQAKQEKMRLACQRAVCAARIKWLKHREG